MYKTRIYKTLRNYLKACGRTEVEANVFFNASSQGFLGSSGNYKDGTHKTFWIKPSDELRAQVALQWEKYHWTHSNPRRLKALSTGYGADFSYLQCFFVGPLYASTCLSGSSYEYCRRKFTQSANP